MEFLHEYEQLGEAVAEEPEKVKVKKEVFRTIPINVE